jgi:hypothetical protein
MPFLVPFIPAIATVGAAAIGANAVSKAAKGQANAANNAAQLQQDQYNQTRTDNEPWRMAGQNALDNLTGILNSGKLSTRFSQADFTNDPGYQFAAKEGQRAIANQANAMGGGGLGAMRRASSFAEDNANKFYNDAFNRWNTQNVQEWNQLSGLAGTGQTANQQIGQAGLNYANNAGNALIGGADASAAGRVEQGNIYGNAINQLGAYWNRGQGNGTGVNDISQYGIPNYAVMSRP